MTLIGNYLIMSRLLNLVLISSPGLVLIDQWRNGLSCRSEVLNPVGCVWYTNLLLFYALSLVLLAEMSLVQYGTSCKLPCLPWQAWSRTR